MNEHKMYKFLNSNLQNFFKKPEGGTDASVGETGETNKQGHLEETK